MSLESKIARELVRAHPERAAMVLDRRRPEEIAQLIEALPPAIAAPMFARLSPYTGTAVFERLPAGPAAAVARELELDVAARLLRRVAEGRRAELFEILPADLVRTLQTLLRFPENSAGALMDPGVLALPEDITVRDALARVRESAEHARYNVYVVDRSQVLVGVINLRELHLARPQAALEEVMVKQPVRLDAHADRSRVVAHPGWREVHSIPVVDGGGCYLGAIRYRTLRQLEEELLGGAGADADAADALGDLFSTGAAAVIDALTGGPSAGRRAD